MLGGSEHRQLTEECLGRGDLVTMPSLMDLGNWMDYHC